MSEGGRSRTWIEFRPIQVSPTAPVVVVLHGSLQDANDIRGLSSYSMERIAAREHFIVVYPDGVDDNWNECRKGGSFTAKKENVNDVSFLRRLVHTERGPSAKALFTGYSSGGQMALRMAIEAPDVTAAAVPVAASTPTPANNGCIIPRSSRVPLMFVNGTSDPFNPYRGGEVAYHGFGSRGNVLGAIDSARFWASRAGDTQGAVVRQGPTTTYTWHGPKPIEQVTVQGGGHQFYSCCARGQRFLGETPQGIDVSSLAWDFYERAHASQGTS